MKELQHIPKGQELALPSAPSFIPSPAPGGEIPGLGLKREYAGVLEYWQMVRRHPANVLLVTFLGGLVAFLLTLSDLRIYQSRISMEIQGLNDDFLNMKSVNATVEANSSYSPDYDIQTQVKILQSRTLLSRVREKLAAGGRTENLPPPDRLSAWRKALKISTPTPDALWRQALGSATGGVKVRSSGTNRIVEVSCDSTSPQVAADFCNTLATEYIEQNLEARWKSTEYTGQWLTKQLQDLKVNLEKSQEVMQSHARATGLVFTDEKGTADDSKLTDLQKTLSEAQTDRIGKQSKYEMAMASPAGALPDVLDDTSLRDSQKAITDLQTKLAQLRITYTPIHPEVKRIQAQIASIEATLQTQRANILRRIRNEYEAAQNREKLLQNAYNTQAGKVSAEAEAESQHTLLKRDVDASRLLYESMLQKLKEASIASALRASNIRVVDPAERPSIPYKPDVRQSVTVGLLTGLLLGVVMVILRERADRTLQDPGDTSFYLNLPELGVVPIGTLLGSPGNKPLVAQLALGGQDGKPAIPGVSTGVDERVELVSWNQKSSLLAESFRTTLTSILFSGQNGDRPRVIVLTSASPKEGKTTVTCNLAITLAEIRHSVLIIDGDMRRPRLHNVFGIDNSHGLSNLLRESAPINKEMLETACFQTAIPGLSVMPSGGGRHSASTLVHSARLPELLKLARETFDTVIVDTPPMVNISDARVLARHADAVILVVRSAATTRDAALLAKRRFAEDGIQLLGIILNWWNPKTPGYGYYRYYYAGYYHYYGNGDGKNGTTNGNGNGNHAGVEAGTDGDDS